MSRLLIILGAVFVVAGLTWQWVRRLPLFRLPGDIVVNRPGFTFVFPLATMLLLSLIVSLIAWLFRR
jgi:hypothetical protein